jgi:signal transduction histidine kinase/CheY-like chemotaxis protein/HPt (histidine-containing phosphotransfer) domain-containing protein
LQPQAADQYAIYSSYRDIPGITAEEINALEALKNRKRSGGGRDYFIYGMLPTTETFYNEDGQIEGYSALFCDWLSTFFGIPFKPAIYKWEDLLAGLQSREIDFTGELTATEERRNVYFMSDAIAEHSIKYMRLANSEEFSEIAKKRPLRYAFLRDTITPELVVPHIAEDFEVFFIDDYDTAYRMLKNGEIDAFFEENIAEAAFDIYGDVRAEDFFPLIYTSVSLATRNPDLEPVISAVQKALQSGGMRHLIELYNQGQKSYMRHKLFTQLSPEEKAYLQDHAAREAAVPLAVEHDNYPISFYNPQEKEWQGIALDVLAEVEELSGLRFRRINDKIMGWAELMGMLERGEAALVTEMIHSSEREGRFLWAEPYHNDYFALLSKSDFRNIGINEVLYAKVGLIEGSGYTDVFREWFPNHANTVEYGTTIDSFTALEKGDVDLIMASLNLLLSQTNFREQPGYKANIVFNRSFTSSFGFNIHEETLKSIIDKSLRTIDAAGISERWTRKMFDYRSKMLRSQIPWLIGLSALILFVLVLLFIMFQRNRREGRQLEQLVYQRTRELKTQTEAAHAASQAKSDFLARMSHEVRTPLNAILGFSEVELEKDLPTETQVNLEKVHHSGMHLLEIVNDILDISKIESGNFEIIPVEYEASRVINGVIQLNIMRIGSKPVEFKLELDETIPSKLYGDELRVKQILNNLLSNAFKYTDAGEVHLIVTWEQESGDARLTFTVTDTGRGIKKEDQEKLFSEYAQFDTKANRRIEGTGLGLSITWGLVEKMGGSISVESEYGKGSSFRVTLLQGIIDKEPVGREMADALRNFHFIGDRNRGRGNTFIRSWMPYGKVLAVDDLETNLDVMKGLLMPYGLQVDTVLSGREAIERIRAEEIRYDLVFMDHMMPGMDGIEAVRIIRNEIGSPYAQQVTIIALTANAVEGNREMFLSSGFNDFISKPIDIKQLDMVLNQQIRDKQNTAALREAEFQARERVEARGEDNSGRGETEAGAESRWLLEHPVEGIDFTAALGLYNGDGAMLISILKSFVTHTPFLIEKMDASLETSLWDYMIEVHGLKGACNTINAPVIAEMAKELEFAAREGRGEYVKARHGELRRRAKGLTDRLKEVIEGWEAGLPGVEEKELRSEPDRALLARLSAAAGVSNSNDTEKILVELEQYRYETGDEFIRRLREQVENFDYDDMHERLEEYLSNG